MRHMMRGIAMALSGLLALCGQLSCQGSSKQATKTAPSPEDIQGIQIATDAYVAYQHADCETVYQLTQPDALDAMQATELRYSLRLVRGFCQEQDGDQPAARVTYRRVVDESSSSSFAAADARERLRILDQLANDRDFARRVEDAERGTRKPADPREPSVRSAALYPPLARASAVEGFAVVEFGVSRQGKTIDPLVVDSEPPFVFDGTALRAVRDWRYKAKRRSDQDQRHVIRIIFRTAVDPVMVDEVEGPGTPDDASVRSPDSKGSPPTLQTSPINQTP